MATIEDRVTDLELAQSATTDAIDRVDRKVDRLAEKVNAMPRVIAESEVRLRTEITEAEQRLGAKIAEVEQRLENRIGGVEQRLGDRIGATERRFVDLLNERFDAVMVALDRLHNPPR